MFTDVLPLRAILFQLLFIVLAIAIEAMVLQNYLGIGQKICIQYAATANLVVTIVGWLIFFLVEPLLPVVLKVQLIGYVFYDRISSPVLLIILAFIIFISAFLLKLVTIEGLDRILDINQPTRETPDKITPNKPRFKGRAQRQPFSELPNRSLAILWANAASFSAVTFVLAVRTYA
ncbi:filament integrity protein FraC [Myxacorys almedinensis]|uniref:Filament integrity protein fraC n=1 Tax=Myxacorys almedinensis A TaxID=2690445 RepID=A0A8J7YXZ3_9CYAN|nr:filament integrity protein FraC [Myxacorys almedinensis]NDJ16687.1 filament integrity protein fraC [Myxacorys almedinensis A]